MRILIEYESSWRNSFLDGNNDSELPPEWRKYIASIKQLNSKTENNFKQCEITQNTVMGILSRLIGDQRKLYQARSSGIYYFSDLENKISFKDNPNVVSNEIVYLRNISGSEDQNSFTGMIKINDPIFTSSYSQEFWGVLNLNLDELCDFILNDTKINQNIDLTPSAICEYFNEKGRKAVEYSGVVRAASDKLQAMFPDYKPLNSKGEQLLLPMYCSALYLQLQRLANVYDMQNVLTAKGKISGISSNGFTLKDFMSKYTTGEKKKIYGNPYIRTEKVKGIGEIKRVLTKVCGKIEISLDISTEKAYELKQMIENAGVSTFYLGKKGLAYVTEISLN